MLNPVSGLNPSWSDPQISLNVTESLETKSRLFRLQLYFLLCSSDAHQYSLVGITLFRTVVHTKFSFIVPVIIKEEHLFSIALGKIRVGEYFPLHFMSLKVYCQHCGMA